ncbi:MAG TPA: hypothetical protein VLD15_04150 [Burkholderiales bacterium]|nr:hypothetical protein [Burkholderiales bacterium]
MTGLLDLAVNFGLAALVLAWTVQGILDLRAQGLRTRPVLKCVGALVLYGVLVGAWFYLYAITKDLVTRMDAFPAVAITGEWGRELKSDKRTEYTRLLASSVFVNSGRFIRYIDQDGALRRYAPSESDVRQRDAWLQNRQESVVDAQLFRQFALVWLSVLPLGLVVALSWPGARPLRR